MILRNILAITLMTATAMTVLAEEATNWAATHGTSVTADMAAIPEIAETAESCAPEVLTILWHLMSLLTVLT